MNQGIFALQLTDTSWRTFEETNYQYKDWVQRPGCFIREAKTWLGTNVVVLSYKRYFQEFGILILAVSPEMDHKLFKVTDLGGIPHLKHHHCSHSNISIYPYQHILKTPAISGPYIVNEFYPHTSTPSANLPAPAAIIAGKKERIKRSPLFSNSLAGRAGLLREIGATYDYGAVTSAWAENLGRQDNLLFSTTPYYHDPLVAEFTSMIYDEDTRNILAAMEHCERGRNKSSMSYLPLRPSPYFELTFS